MAIVQPQVTCENALTEYFERIAQYEQRRSDGRAVDRLPDDELKKFIIWCQKNGDPDLVRQVRECLAAGDVATIAMKLAGCVADQKSAPSVSHTRA